MSYLVLARKYRPAGFDEIIGQEHVTRTLRNAINKGKIHHAFLFTGTRGVGKTTTARVLAKALCCLSSDGPTDEPCHTCAACTAISHGQSVDVSEIDGASNNSVNDIRDLRDNVQYRPQQARFKIYIIDEVHMLSTSAFNALLKTLEEPPDHVKFIFATTESHKIPQTILSRCQRYDFKAVPSVELAGFLKDLIGREGVGIADAALKTVVRLARGSVRDALSLMDAVIAYAGETISEEDVRVVLGLADAAVFERITAALIKRDAPAVFAAVGELVDYGHDLRQFGADFLEYLRDAVMLAFNRQSGSTLERADSELQQLKRFAGDAQPAEWVAWFDLMVEGQERIARSERARIMLELTLAKMLQVGRIRDIDELLAGLNRLTGGQGNAPAASRGPARRPAPGSATRSESPTPAPKAESAAPAVPSDEPPPPDDADAFSNRTAPTPPIDLAERRQQAAPNEPSAIAPPTSIPTDWESLVDAFKGQSRSLWSLMRQVGLLEFSPTRIRLEAPRGSRALQQLGHGEGKRRFEAQLREIMGESLVVDLREAEGEKPGALSIAEKERQQETAQRNAAIKKGKADPTVRLIREVFGGGEVHVRSLENTKKANGNGN